MIKFTPSNVTQMEDEMVEVLNKYGFKNVTFSGNTRSFGSNETTFKIVANINGTTSNADAALEYHAQLDGIDLSRKGAKGQELIEYHPRKRKYPYIYKSVSGKRYKTSAMGWKSLL